MAFDLSIEASASASALRQPLNNRPVNRDSNKEQLLADLDWSLRELALTTQEWIDRAKGEGVDIQKIIDKIAKVILDAASFQDPHQSAEVIYRQQLLLRGIYCSQIMRKITKHRICQTAEVARQMPALHSYLDLINGCERWLLIRLPGKLLKEPSKMREVCLALEYKMEEMQKALFKRARIHQAASKTDACMRGH